MSEKLEEFDNPSGSVFKGGYPMVHSLNMHPLDFYPSYIQTYIERDIRQLKNIEDCNRFQTFLKLCAGRICPAAKPSGSTLGKRAFCASVACSISR